MDLFKLQENQVKYQPLSEKLRPKTLNDFIGQNRIITNDFKKKIELDKITSLILWGPPGCGKTTTAKLIQKYTRAIFIDIQAVETGAKELKQIGDEARDRNNIQNEKTILFIDEIHRLRRDQQDVLLGFIERGEIIFIGATTENPSYELNSALLSRSQVLQFQRLTDENLNQLFYKALPEVNLTINDFSEKSVEKLVEISNGDGRRLLNFIETLGQWKNINPTLNINEINLLECIQSQGIYYDKKSEEHFSTISAFIKSLRGSDPNASVYYLVRMLEGGEDPVFIARRLVVFASEDIGNADPRALQLAISGLQAVELIGLPECKINLSQIVTYLASAPKSNRSYQALKKAEVEVKKTGNLKIPNHLINAVTEFDKNIGQGNNYEYPHDLDHPFSDQNYLPDGVSSKDFYQPSQFGFEKNIKEYLEWLKINKINS